MGAATAQKTTDEPTVPVGALVKQAHGGALRNGGTNRGGPGVAPSALRERLRGSFAQRESVITDIADGKPCQTVRMSLASLSSHLVCANCGESEIKPDSPEAMLVEINVEVSASPKDRLAALDLMAKYGLGALKEVSRENVQERLKATLETIRSVLGADEAETVITAIQGHWT